MFQNASRRAISLAFLLVASITFQSFAFMPGGVAMAQKLKPLRVPGKPTGKPTGGVGLNPPSGSITATKVDAWDDTATPDGKAEPGQTITYTVTITNNGAVAATGVTFTDNVDPNTTLVPGSVATQPIAVADSYNVIGNVRIQPNAAAGLLANDSDPDPGDTLTASGPTTTTQGGNLTINADGSFSYNPPVGFAGTDTFTYTITDSTSKTDTAVATLRVGNGTATPGTNVVWFVDPNAGPGGDGRLTSPFNCYTGGTASCFSQTAADDPGDTIFLYSGAHTGGYTLLSTQKLIGQGASASLATISALTVQPYSDALPTTGGASPTMTTTNANAVPLGLDNTVRGFTIGNVGTGTKISGVSFGTLTVGNNTTPDMILNGTGQALNLSTGTLAATSAFASVESTSSSGQGINLAGLSGTLAMGSTTISGSTTQGILVGTTTAAINFGNTSVSGGTDGVSFQNNSSGTRTFGTLSISNNSGIGFLHAAGGGNVSVTGATLIPAAAQTAPAGTGIDINALAVGTSVAFADVTVNKGNAGTGVSLGTVANPNLGNVSFNSLGITTSNGTGLVSAANTGTTGSITVTTNAGSISATSGPAINITKTVAPATPITLNFTSVSSTNSGTQGINLDRVSGNATIGTTTTTNPTGVGIQVQNTSAGGTMNFGNTTSNTSGGTGVNLASNAGGVTFNALNIAPDATFGGISVANSSGTTTSSSGTITTTDAPAVLVSASALSMTLTSVSADNTGDADSCISLTTATGTLTMNGGALIGGSASAFLISGGTVASTFNGTITQSTAAQRAVDVQNKTGGTSAFGGLITATTTTANAIHLATNTGATINFTGGLNLTTTTGISFNATGGGTVSATQNNTSIVNTLTSTTGTALNVANTTIGASGLTFRSISSNGSVNGIVLNNTGSNAGLTVTGNSAGNCGGSITTQPLGTLSTANAPVTADCTGGTIQSTTGHGILLTNTKNVSLTRMYVHDAANGFDEINAQTLNGFTLDHSFITDSAGVGGDRGIEIGDFTTGTPVNGTVTISNSTIGPTAHDNIGVGIASGTSTWNFTTDVLTGSTLDSGMNFEVRNATVTAFTMDGCVVKNQFADGMQINPASGVNATISNATIQNSSFTTNNIHLDLNHDGTGTSTYKVLNNTFISAVANTINFFSSSVQAPGTGGILNGRFVNNRIGNNAIANSGGGVGIRININGGAAGRVLVDSNVIRQVKDGRGIEIISRNGTGGLDATVTNNDVSAPINTLGAFAQLAAIFLQSNCVTVCNTLRSDIRSNTVPSTPATDGEFANGMLQIVRSGASTNQLVDNAPASPDAASELASHNTGSTAVTGTVTLIPGPINTPPLFFARGGVESAIHSSSLLTNLLWQSFEVESSSRSNGFGSAVEKSNSLTQSQLDTLVASAVQHWSVTGLTAQQMQTLRAVKFEVTDLHGKYLGESGDNRILIDRWAAGRGWFVDPTPDDNSEFGAVVCATRRYTDPMNVAAGRVDLLTAIEHEIGHKLGLDDSYAEADRDSIMYGYLTVGERRLPAAGQAANAPANAMSATPHFLKLADDKSSEIRGQRSAVRLHHAKTTRALTPIFGSGGTVTVNIGTLAPGDSVTITFQVVIDNPYTGGPNVSNQGSVSGNNPSAFTNLTNDPDTVAADDPTLTPINSLKVSVKDAKVAEPTSGSINMVFTVALSAPAGAGGPSVDFTTADEPAGPGKAVAGTDYTTTSGTINFTSGQQVRTINVPVLSDGDNAEPDETFLVNLSNASGALILDGQAVGTITAANPPGTFLISELRTFGPGPTNDPNDEYVEFYNNTDSILTVAASDASAGYGVFVQGANCDATPVLVGTIPNGTVIPKRGHYLMVGSAYSLANYGGTGAAAGNLTLSSDIPTNGNVAVFSTSDITSISSTNRLDAVGFGTNINSVCDLLREPTNVDAATTDLTMVGQYSYFRKECDFAGGCQAGGNPKETNNNSADFMFADANARSAGPTPHLGAPGPENLASPLRRDTSGIGAVVLDTTVSSSSPPNRFRSFASNPPNEANGSLEVRRRVVNSTGSAVTRLRFRIVELTTAPTPPVGIADLRAVTSSPVTLMGIMDAATCASTGTPATAPCQVTAQATVLETPPAQANGGGYNSTLTVAIPGGLAPNASINVNFRLGVVQPGTFRFLIIIEALP